MTRIAERPKARTNWVVSLWCSTILLRGFKDGTLFVERQLETQLSKFSPTYIEMLRASHELPVKFVRLVRFTVNNGIVGDKRIVREMQLL